MEANAELFDLRNHRNKIEQSSTVWRACCVSASYRRINGSFRTAIHTPSPEQHMLWIRGSPCEGISILNNGGKKANKQKGWEMDVTAMRLMNGTIEKHLAGVKSLF